MSEIAQFGRIGNETATTWIYLPAGEHFVGGERTEHRWVGSSVPGTEDNVWCGRCGADDDYEAADERGCPGERIVLERPVVVATSPVSNADWRRFMADGLRREKKAFLERLTSSVNVSEERRDDPATGISHADAIAFCAWLTEQESVECEACKGDGTAWAQDPDDPNSRAACYACHGTGRRLEIACPECGGDGIGLEVAGDCKVCKREDGRLSLASYRLPTGDEYNLAKVLGIERPNPKLMEWTHGCIPLSDASKVTFRLAAEVRHG